MGGGATLDIGDAAVLEPGPGFLVSTGWLLIVGMAAIVTVFNLCRRYAW